MPPDADQGTRLAAEGRRLAGVQRQVATTWEQLASYWHNADHKDPAAVRALPAILTQPDAGELVSWGLRMAEECHRLLGLSFAATRQLTESRVADFGHRAMAHLSAAPSPLHKHLEERLGHPTWTSLQRWSSRRGPEVLALAELALASLALARETQSFNESRSALSA